MSPEILDGAEFFVYKMTCLLVGLAFCYMGYRLFLAGFDRPGSDFAFNLEKIAVKLGKAAPGTCFAIFGAIIICGAVWKGYSSQGGFSNVARAADHLQPNKVQLDETPPRE
jgi:hypothetical protein